MRLLLLVLAVTAVACQDPTQPRNIGLDTNCDPIKVRSPGDTTWLKYQACPVNVPCYCVYTKDRPW